MYEWQRQIQKMIDVIDLYIKMNDSESLSLSRLSKESGYSEFYISKKFKEISGMQFRDYLRYRRLAFALKEAYGITPSEYRRHPGPVALRTIIKPFDCYLSEIGANHMGNSEQQIKTYYVTIPAHKFLHIKNYESIGYWDFWQKQSLIPGQDCETICGLLDSIKGKLDDMGGNEANSGNGQIMAYINEPAGRICSWGIPLAECYGVRLPADYDGDIPPQMLLIDVPEGEYLVFEHGPFDFERENQSVEEKIEAAMKAYDYTADGYRLDTTPGRIFYFYHDPERFWKYVRPVRKITQSD